MYEEYAVKKFQGWVLKTNLKRFFVFWKWQAATDNSTKRKIQGCWQLIKEANISGSPNKSINIYKWSNITILQYGDSMDIIAMKILCFKCGIKEKVLLNQLTKPHPPTKLKAHLKAIKTPESNKILRHQGPQEPRRIWMETEEQQIITLRRLHKNQSPN